MATNPSAFTATAASIGAAPAAAVAWQPSDQGLLDAVDDLWAAQSTNVLTAGTVYLVKLIPRTSHTITNIQWLVTSAGVGASTGSFAGLYSSAGTLLSGSADIGGSLLSAAPLTVALTTPQAVTAGQFVWAAIVVNLATTQPTMRCGNGRPADTNSGLTNATFRFATNGTSQTTLPASFTPSANAQGAAFTLWAGTS